MLLTLAAVTAPPAPGRYRVVVCSPTDALAVAAVLTTLPWGAELHPTPHLAPGHGGTWTRPQR